MPSLEGLGSFVLGSFCFAFGSKCGVVGFCCDDFDSSFEGLGLGGVMDAVNFADGIAVGFGVHEVVEDEAGFGVGG